MKFMKAALAATAMLFTSSIASAYILAQRNAPGKQAWDPNHPTRIIFASKDLAFASVGYQQFEVLKRNHSSDQYVFLTTFPTSTTSKQSALKQKGFVLVKDDAAALSSPAFFKELSALKNIKSMHMIGHNGAQLGPWLQDADNRWNYKAERLKELQSNFAADAYIHMLGCNSGWHVAPSISKLLQVPVISTFTSTALHVLTNTQEYELYSEAVVANRKTENCTQKTCMNLRPESTPYHFGKHQNPKAIWLPIAKPVCHANISDDRCRKAYATSLLDVISSQNKASAYNNLEDFQNIFFDQVCGAYASADSQVSCRQAVRTALLNQQNYFPFRYGQPLDCPALRACSFNEVNNDLRLNTSNKGKDEISTIRDSYEEAIAGWRLLQ